MLLTRLVFGLSGQISEDLGGEKFCVDAGQAGAGSWLKYIRVACSCDDQNLTMCQIDEQVGPCPCSRPGGRAAEAEQHGGAGATVRWPLPRAFAEPHPALGAAI